MYLRYGKRAFDILIGLALMLGLSWLMLMIWLGYLITMQFPVIFKQVRIGKDNVPFVMFKFRTLTSADLPLQERRFAWGDFLRLTNLDEMPQLWNVLKGEMSLVGPRPMPVEYAPLFTAEQRTRHQIKPGITGYAQVYGKNDLSWEKKFKYDLDYLNRVSFRTDVTILLKTVILVLSLKGDVSLMEEKFKG